MNQTNNVSCDNYSAQTHIFHWSHASQSPPPMKVASVKSRIHAECRFILLTIDCHMYSIYDSTVYSIYLLGIV